MEMLVEKYRIFEFIKQKRLLHNMNGESALLRRSPADTSSKARKSESWPIIAWLELVGIMKATLNPSTKFESLINPKSFQPLTFGIWQATAI